MPPITRFLRPLWSVSLVGLAACIWQAANLLGAQQASAEEPPPPEPLACRYDERLAGEYVVDENGNLAPTYDQPPAITVSGVVVEIDKPLVQSPSIQQDVEVLLQLEQPVELHGSQREEILFIYCEHSFLGPPLAEGDRVQLLFDEEGRLIDAYAQQDSGAE